MSDSQRKEAINGVYAGAKANGSSGKAILSKGQYSQLMTLLQCLIPFEEEEAGNDN
jgi:hypothetical protein